MFTYKPGDSIKYLHKKLNKSKDVTKNTTIGFITLTIKSGIVISYRLLDDTCLVLDDESKTHIQIQKNLIFTGTLYDVEVKPLSYSSASLY